MTETLASNPWVWATAGGLLTGGMLAAFKSGRDAAWRAVFGRFATVITVDNDDPLYHWVKVWLARHPYTSRSRTLQATTGQDEPGAVQSSGPVRLSFVPGHGRHWFRHAGRLVSVKKVASQVATQSYTSYRAMQKEWYEITVLTRDPAAARDMLADAIRRAVDGGDGRKTTFYGLGQYGGWVVIDQRVARHPDSVVLPGTMWDDIRADVTAFKTREADYRALGVPYRRGYLFEGPPGSGKTSAAVALAGLARMDVCIISLADSTLTDAKLRNLMDGASASSMILIEDVDATMRGRELENQGSAMTGDKLTFSGVLNALDGAAAKEGRVVVMTTNHPDKLDPALLRPGRIDRRFHVGAADADQAARLFRRFYPSVTQTEAVGFAAALPAGLSMAALQGYLLARIADPFAAVTETAELGAAA